MEEGAKYYKVKAYSTNLMANYDAMRSYMPEHRVFAQVMSDASRLIEHLDVFHLDRPDILGNFATQVLRVISSGESKQLYDGVVAEMRRLYQEGVARDITGPILQDLQEGMHKLETLAETHSRVA